MSRQAEAPVRPRRTRLRGSSPPTRCPPTSTCRPTRWTSTPTTCCPREAPTPGEGENPVNHYGHSTMWDGSFSDARVQFLERTTPWFQIQWADAMDELGSGEVALIIAPPGYAKTSFIEDKATIDLAQNPLL